ncbi:DUF732 domain-containing protein [Streptomyces sp. DT193]|uniref:DUF732 domain-containing protein n=1 Tax=Streptomyces sp. DT193 TaxID=3393418 RepID=UPI003CEB2FFA
MALALFMAGGLAGCGSGSGSAGTSALRSSPSETGQQEDARFLAIVEQQGVLSTKPDADLVKLGHLVCQDDLGMLKAAPNLAAAEVVSKDHSLTQAEAEAVVQAAIRIYCPDMAP